VDYVRTVIRATVVYPRGDGKTFDADYWLNKHMPMLTKELPQLAKWEADIGGPDQPHHAIAFLLFDSAEDFGTAMTGPGAPNVFADVANYTNIQPQMYVSEISKTS